MVPDSSVPSDRRRAVAINLNRRSYIFDFFALGVAEHWNRLPREVVESPFLETFTHLVLCLCYLL